MEKEILLSKIKAAKDQPRKYFDQEAIKSLAESIKSQGLLQPIVVVPLDGGYYRIVIGERRYRACKLLGLQTIKCLIIKTKDEFAISLIEQSQREDLSPVEKAEAYKKILASGFTQGELGKRIGRSQSQVAQTLSMLSLPPFVQLLLRIKKIDEGHGQQLLRFKNLLQGFVFPDEKEMLKGGAGIYRFPKELMEKFAEENEAISKDEAFLKYCPEKLNMKDFLIILKATCAARFKDSVAKMKDNLENLYLHLVYCDVYEERNRIVGHIKFTSSYEKLVAFLQYQLIRLRRGENWEMYDGKGKDEAGEVIGRPATHVEREELIKHFEQEIKEVRELEKNKSPAQKRQM